jgi:AAA domain
MKVINLFGGPGSGKSTTAAGLFYEMKMAGCKVELVTEYAKDLFYSGILHIMTPLCQEILFAEQHYRIDRLRDHVDFAIVDSPIPLSLIYGNKKPTSDTFYQLVMESFDQFDNINFFLQRPEIFQDGGRMQNLEQSQEIDRRILEVLDKYYHPVTHLQANKHVVGKILSHLGV